MQQRTGHLKPLPVYEARAGQNHLRDAFEDIAEGFKSNPIWLELVRRDVYAKTKGSALGNWWFVIAQAVATLGMGVVYSNLFGMPIATYLPYLACGMITWSLILTLLNEGSEVFVSSRGYLTQARLPLSVCLFRFISRNLILFLYKSSIIVVVLLFFQVPQGWSSLLSLVGIAMIAIAGFLAGAVLGMLNARFRDVSQLVSSASVFLFFMTPIMWHAERLGKYQWIADYNPLHHFLDLVRSPLIGEPVTYWSFVMIGLTIAVLAVLASIVYKQLGREVIYWI